MKKKQAARIVVAAVFLALGQILGFVEGSLHAQLNENCTISVLNRTVRVNPDGSWVVPNVPVLRAAQVRARATCVIDGVTISGKSDFFTVPANGAVGPINIKFGEGARVPAGLSVTSASNAL